MSSLRRTTPPCSETDKARASRSLLAPHKGSAGIEAISLFRSRVIYVDTHRQPEAARLQALVVQDDAARLKVRIFTLSLCRLTKAKGWPSRRPRSRRCAPRPCAINDLRMPTGPVASGILTEACSISTRCAPGRPPAGPPSPRRCRTRRVPARLGASRLSARLQPSLVRCSPARQQAYRRRGHGTLLTPTIAACSGAAPAPGELPLRQPARFELLGDAQPLWLLNSLQHASRDELSSSSS